MENRRKNRGRRKRKEGGLERIAKRDERGRKKKEWGERERKDGRNHTSSVKFFAIASYCGDDLFSSSFV